MIRIVQDMSLVATLLCSNVYSVAPVSTYGLPHQMDSNAIFPSLRSSSDEALLQRPVVLAFAGMEWLNRPR